MHADLLALPFRELWAADFEFAAPDGERPRPFCLVARELRSGRTVKLFGDELTSLAAPPYAVDKDALFIAFYASAEMTCHLALGWPMPEHVLDLFTEYRCLTNGHLGAKGASLLAALFHFGLPHISALDKEAMRNLAMRGAPFSEEERRQLLDYCASDVDALEALLPKMLPTLDLLRALVRGRFMKAAARIEHRGVPIDVPSLTSLRHHWNGIQERFVATIGAEFGVYEGKRFRRDLFAGWLAAHDIPWPLHPSGELKLDDDTFGDMAHAYPMMKPLHQLRQALSGMRLADLAVGADGRNRCLLSAFGSVTGRNQPSNSRFIFGPSAWLRSLIQPPPGHAVAYLDWAQQEFAIAAVLSGDTSMIAAYVSGDPYLAFAKQAGAVPPSATKQTHKEVRDQFKLYALGVLYGMGADSLARQIGQPVARARELLELHRRTYPVYWAWSERALNHALLCGSIHTTFGWTAHTALDPNPRTYRNFPMQANGAEMMRLACCFATERGFGLCAPVHDALLIEAPLTELDEAIAGAETAMRDASVMVLSGFALRTDAKVVRHPDRFVHDSPAATRMWKLAWNAVADLERAGAIAPQDPGPSRPGTWDTASHPCNLFSSSSVDQIASGEGA